MTKNASTQRLIAKGFTEQEAKEKLPLCHKCVTRTPKPQKVQDGASVATVAGCPFKLHIYTYRTRTEYLYEIKNIYWYVA
jgi:hypothetical protein